MTRRVNLPGGGWADIKDPTELTNRDRKLLRRGVMPAMTVRTKLLDQVQASDIEAVQADPANIPADVAERLGGAMTGDDMDAMSDAQAACIVAYTAAWSLDGTTAGPALTVDTVDDLPAPIFDLLAEQTAGLGDGTPTVSIDGAGDDSSPTVPSGV